MSKRIVLTARLTVIAALIGLCGCDLDWKPPKPEDKQLKGPTAVLFSIDGSMPQFSNPSAMFASLSMSQRRFENLLVKAASDLQVQEIVIHFGGISASFARVGEIAQAIRKAAESGKPVTCHLDDADNLTYWVAASACPKLLISPAGSIEALGLSLEVVFVRELLSSIGVTADLLSAGKYKDAAEPLTRDSMSPEARESATSLLGELHRVFVTGIATGRELEEPAVQELIEEGPYGAQRAVELKLADGVSTLGDFLDTLRGKYAGGVVDDYGEAPPKPFSFTELMNLLSGGGDKKKQSTNPRVALVPVIGAISSGSPDELFGDGNSVYDAELVKALSELTRDDSVLVVVLRIDSPGGSPLASDNIWHAVRALAAKKPVVVSMGDVAASGGYYIASAGTEVFASPATITGSIGVFGGKMVIGEAATKLGIHTERIETAKRASLTSPFTPFGEDGRKVMRQQMQRIYDQFVDRIVEGRSMERHKVLEAAEGRVWSGTQALEHGLVDKSGTLADAIDRARELAQLPPGAPVEVYPKPKNLMEILQEAMAEPDSASIAALAKRHRAFRQAIILTELLLDEQVLTFAPMLYQIR